MEGGLDCGWNFSCQSLATTTLFMCKLFCIILIFLYYTSLFISSSDLPFFLHLSPFFDSVTSVCVCVDLYNLDSYVCLCAFSLSYLFFNLFLYILFFFFFVYRHPSIVCVCTSLSIYLLFAYHFLWYPFFNPYLLLN